MATITRSELDVARLRRSADDAARLTAALMADGTLTVVDDEEPELVAETDPEGNEIKDDEGNTVYKPPPPASTVNDALEIELDEGGLDEPVPIPEDIVVEVAPGTQNAAAPFPGGPGDTGGRAAGGSKRGSRRSKSDSESKES